jgi:prefoldin subunit 5
MANSRRAEYLQGEIQRLQGVIAHLENAGTKIYNNASPHVFEETSHTRARRQAENHPPEIFQKSGEDFLTEFRQTLEEYQRELANLQKKF